MPADSTPGDDHPATVSTRGGEKARASLPLPVGAVALPDEGSVLRTVFTFTVSSRTLLLNQPHWTEGFTV